MFHSVHPCSPVAQEFIWVAEHRDQLITEYDFLTKEENKLSQIDRENLIRFGLVGRGQRFYYEVFGGTFNIIGKTYDFSLISNDVEIPLTCRQHYFSDFISYKNAETYVNLQTLETVVEPHITDFVFGYKSSLTSNTLSFQFQSECVISYDNPMYFNKKRSDT